MADLAVCAAKDIASKPGLCAGGPGFTLGRWMDCVLGSAVGASLVMATETLPGIVEETKEKVSEAFAKSWNVIVWNDPVNLMTYVVFVFMKVLGFPKEKATKHMLEVHQQGKSVVATETREKAELYYQQIQSYGLMVTIEQSD
jgi:ATP-dependent Clp protease adaptor protein ClpS